jgi:uncharacterized radical SAM protein YgiQ
VPAGTATIRLPSFGAIRADPRRLMEGALALERHVQSGAGWACQASEQRTVVIAAPPPPPSGEDLDALYALPFTRRAHPSYREPIPAVEMIQFSVTTHRGCAGGCSFCSLAAHQGRRIASRSAGSVVAEVRGLTRHPAWRGSLSDVGGPSANLWGARCRADPAACRRPSCLAPEVCEHFEDRQSELADLLRALAALPGVKHVRTASGIRHDVALRNEPYLRALVTEFVGGQLKLAPEHNIGSVLRLMRKPAFGRFEDFLAAFERLSAAVGKEQYVVPYLISAFPGCADDDMRSLARWLRARGWKPQQVQCFIPLPGTVAAAMYAGGIAPDGRPIPVARTDAERLRQHRILVG